MLYKHILPLVLPFVSCFPLEESSIRTELGNSLSPRVECGSKDVQCTNCLAPGTMTCEGRLLRCTYLNNFVSGFTGFCVLCDGQWIPERLWTQAEYDEYTYGHLPSKW
jgi:hypothetical protein